MQFEIELLIASVLVLGLAVSWWYARRKLSDREMAAWQWRAEHPYLMWVRFLIVAFFGILVAICAYTVNENLAYRALSFETILFALRTIPGRYLFDLWLFSVVIGSVVFAFWFWNGLALYRGRLLELTNQRTGAATS
jgi:ABC-type proline/glycine betaine transport system permease subunit